jgi:hypothetical protein
MEIQAQCVLQILPNDLSGENDFLTVHVVAQKYTLAK